MNTKPLRAWSDRIATIYREREDGRIIMIPLESPAHESLLGAAWIGDDFDKSPHYQRISLAEADAERITGEKTNG